MDCKKVQLIFTNQIESSIHQSILAEILTKMSIANNLVNILNMTTTQQLIQVLTAKLCFKSLVILILLFL
jgi:mannitol/fructose-specific phosphotransferase system IIA component (Ntr-type)